MKRILKAILLLLTLSATITGCGGRPSYDERLVMADSLMNDQPDSAKFYLDIPYSDVTKMYDSSSTPGLLPEIIINCPIKVLNPK